MSDKNLDENINQPSGPQSPDFQPTAGSTRPISRRRAVRLLGLSAFSATVLAACGDSSTSSTGTTAASSATTQAATTGPATTVATPTTSGTTTAPTTAAPAPTITPVPPVQQASGSLKLTFWYGLGGGLGNEILQLVNKYNQSQNKYYIEAIFQSSYEDTINKVNAALAGGTLPNILQIYEPGTQRMIDSQRVIPMQTFIDRDKRQDIVDDLEPAMRTHYTVGGKLYPMPFNTSTAMMYVDKKALREAGLDANKTIWTYEEILDAAKKTVKKDAGGKVTRTGMAIYVDAWYMEQAQSIGNVAYAEPDNGLTGRASKYVFNNETAVKWLELQKKILDEGAGIYYGATGNNEATAAFINGGAAIHLNSVASLRNYLDLAAKAGNKIELGMAFLPRPAQATGRSTVGGAALWITDQGNKEQQEGAWEFMKFIIRGDNQATFAANTGYLPAVKSAYEQKDFKDALAKYPQFQVAVDQIRAAAPNNFNSGVIAGNFVPTREQLVRGAVDSFYSGKASSAKAALDDAVKRANEALDEYNSTVKK